MCSWFADSCNYWRHNLLGDHRESGSALSKWSTYMHAAADWSVLTVLTDHSDAKTQSVGDLVQFIRKLQNHKMQIIVSKLTTFFTTVLLDWSVISSLSTISQCRTYPVQIFCCRVTQIFPSCSCQTFTTGHVKLHHSAVYWHHHTHISWIFGSLALS